MIRPDEPSNATDLASYREVAPILGLTWGKARRFLEMHKIEVFRQGRRAWFVRRDAWDALRSTLQLAEAS